MTNLMKFTAILFLMPLLACSCKAQPQEPVSLSEEFKNYWYSGNAELSQYQIEQVRYGEKRDGYSVLIFVTEDFNLQQQVKQEQESSGEHTKVLKLNRVRKFTTGIYDYSLMTSVFSPVDRTNFPRSLKITSSVQDWCGQTFTQFNYRNGKYEYQQFSYFQAEGDQELTLDGAWTEDEIWTRIRINHESLPLGECKVIPAGSYLRLHHEKAAVYDAKAQLNLEVNDRGEEFFVYILNYDDIERSLRIRFEKEFPHQIMSWQELGEKSKVFVDAKLKETVHVPYWELNQTEHLNYRDSLGIGY